MSAEQPVARAGKDVVWIVESGDYEQRGIDLVAASPEAAVAAIKGRYDNGHYVVRWEDPTSDDRGWTLVGHFDAVPGWSTEHRAIYDITEYEVVR